MKLPTLYQLTNTGAVQQWTIETSGEADGPGIITTEFGQVDGKLQRTSDTITKGKNPGKANATTAAQQAEKEAKAKWEKQKKKGYVESIEDARAGKVDSSVILGGVAPMLAPNKSYPKDDELQKRIVFPCYVQPKLDGMRCIAVVKDGKCTLWSRTRKPIRSVPHIVTALEAAFPTGSATLDGELYNHDYRNNFEDLISILRRDAPDPEGLYKDAEYHIYDCVEMELPTTRISMETPFKSRSAAIAAVLAGIERPLVIVNTKRAESMAELVEAYEACLIEEYEGTMARNGSAPYEPDRRSVNLQKMKSFEDFEFRIVGVNEGRGKDAGTAATFTCLTKEGKEFKARLKAPYARRRELLANPKLWEGKQLTVTVKRFTADGIPYLPVAKAVRDYD